MTKAILIAISLTLINAISSLIVVKIAMNKDWKSFNKLIFGSFAIRYFITGGLVWICVKYLELHILAFSLTFMVSTFFLLLAEIVWIHRKNSLKR